MKVLIDNGHGENTPGKRSPDGPIQEKLPIWLFSAYVKKVLMLNGS